MKPHIIKDTREHEGKGWDFPENELFAGTVVKKLDTGDYSIEGYENVITIERKASIGELVSWLFEPRCHDNLDRLATYVYKYLVLEFNIYDVMAYPNTVPVSSAVKAKMKTKPKYILRRLNEMLVEHDIPYIFAGNESYAREMVESLLKRVYLYEFK